jgi:hypothetical protein
MRPIPLRFDLLFSLQLHGQELRQVAQGQEQEREPVEAPAQGQAPLRTFPRLLEGKE